MRFVWPRTFLTVMGIGYLSAGGKSPDRGIYTGITERDMIKYRLYQYRPRAWSIQELKTTPVINEKTGKPNKSGGESKWVDIKYPGTLAQAAAHLLELEIGLKEEVDLKELLVALKAAEKRVVSAITEYVNK